MQLLGRVQGEPRAGGHAGRGCTLGLGLGDGFERRATTPGSPGLELAAPARDAATASSWRACSGSGSATASSGSATTPAAPDGSPCNRGTRGLLRRRRVELATLTILGSESNRYPERLAGLHYGDDETQTEYEPLQPGSIPTRWRLVLETLSDLPDARIAELAGLDRGTVAAARNGEKAQSSTRAALTEAAGRIAAEALSARGTTRPPRRLESRLALYLREREGATCPECGGPVKNQRATYCEDACRQKAYRARRAAA